MTVHRHIDDELLVLQRMLFEMADLVDEQMANAIDALLRRDLELAERVRGAGTRRSDAYELNDRPAVRTHSGAAPSG